MVSEQKHPMLNSKVQRPQGTPHVKRVCGLLVAAPSPVQPRVTTGCNHRRSEHSQAQPAFPLAITRLFHMSAYRKSILLLKCQNVPRIFTTVIKVEFHTFAFLSVLKIIGVLNLP